MEQCSALLSVVFQEYVPEDEEGVGKSYELLRQTSVDFQLDAYHQIEGVKHNLRAAWHIDTHLYVGTRRRNSILDFIFRSAANALMTSMTVSAAC